MTTTATNNTESITKYSHLDEFAQLLRNNGFTVIVSKYKSCPLPTWLHFEKNGLVGYVQADKYGEFKFSSVYKPSKGNGTGCGIAETYEPTIELANRVLNSPVPAGIIIQGSIVRYSGLDEFVKYQGKFCETIVLPKLAD